MTDIQNKSQEELLALIAEAQTQLEALKRSHYKAVIAKIKELAASIDVTVDIHETNKPQPTKNPAKFRNPDNPLQTWTGQGMAPKWLKDLVEKGHNKDEFLIDNNTQ
jgi:DNA-binding protein H-NS